MKFILTAHLIGCLTLTSYRAIPAQTDSSPNYTSTNEHVEAGGCAISRDLLCGACRRLHHRCKEAARAPRIHYGDWLFVKDFGFYRVNDLMGEYSSQKVKGKWRRYPLRQHVDLFVKTYREESLVNVKKKAVYKIVIGE